MIFIVAIIAASVVVVFPTKSSSAQAGPHNTSAYGDWTTITPSPTCRTSPTTRDGERGSCDAPEQCIVARNGQVFVQRSATLARTYNGENPRCSMQFYDYIVLPDFTVLSEPRRACAGGSVKSKGGVPNQGHRGNITCQFKVFSRPL